MIQKVLISFDKLYTITLPAAFPEKYGRTSGKRLMPFRDKEQLAASDRRWASILLYCVSEKVGRKNEVGYGPFFDCLDFAIDAILNREPGAQAPLGGGSAAWEKLLDATHKAKYKEWGDTTLLGLDTINLEPAQRAYHEAEAERQRNEAAKKAEQRAKRSEAAKERRKLTKLGSSAQSEDWSTL